MAFFKFRKGGDEHATPAPAAESVEAMRTRARHRLIGASVLVVLGVVGFPLLFDSQPRPIAVDIAIEIPDKNTVKPLGSSAPVKSTKPAADVVVESDAGKEHVSAVPAGSASRAATGTVTVAKAEPKPVEKPVVKPPEKTASKPADKPADKPPAAPADDGAKARALLEGKEAVKAASAPAAASAPVAAATGRFVVQIGAFSDAVKAHEARVKLEKAGLKTYTQVVQPKEGKRIRVRVGPFESKPDADKVAEKIRKLDLPAAILEL